MKNYKFTVELRRFITKSAGKLRAFRAAAVAVIVLPFALSCTKEESPLCLDGDCSAVMIAPGSLDENGFIHVDLSWEQEFYPYFIVDILASSIDPVEYIGGNPIATGKFDSDTSWIVGDTLVVQQAYYEPFSTPWTSNGPLPANIDNLVLTQFKGVEVNVAQGSLIYFKEDQGEFTSRRTIGPFPPHMVNDTITVFMEITWRGATQTVKKSNYLEKFILE